MKKLLIGLFLLFIVLPVGARSTLEVAPKVSYYYGDSDLFTGSNIGLAGDILYNPTNSFGIRITLLETIFGDNTIFLLNSRNAIDALFYIPIRGLKTYLNTSISITSIEGITDFWLGGGIGLEYYMGGGKKLFLEPNLLFTNFGIYDTDFWFRLSVGLKFKVIEWKNSNITY